MTPSILVTLVQSVMIPSKSFLLKRNHSKTKKPSVPGVTDYRAFVEVDGDVRRRRWERNLNFFSAAHPPILVALRSDGFSGREFFLMEDEKPIVYKQLEAEPRA